MKNPKERLQRVCVIGATPAGIAATNKLGEMGIPVTLIDEAPDLNEKLASDVWRMPSGVSFNYAVRPGLLRIMRNPRIKLLLPASIKSIKHTPQGFSVRHKKMPHMLTQTNAPFAVFVGRIVRQSAPTAGRPCSMVEGMPFRQAFALTGKRMGYSG